MNSDGSIANNHEGKGREPQGKSRRYRSRRGKILIVAGISLIILGLLALAGIYIYISLSNRSFRKAQEKLARSWEENPTGDDFSDVRAGDAIARLIVPKLELDVIVVELSSLDDTDNLNRGPGHIPGTAYPGQRGNCVISGHRTTYGAPFKNIQALEPGDLIILVTKESLYTYEMYEQRIVLPTDLTVLEQGEEPKVTLTACHPWYSAKQRIVVIGRLIE